jgi:MinD-like ATPase involved in chromosome partitioning or flagellar assembly
MELTEKILTDKEMVPLFLQYMKMHLRQQDLPQTLPLEAEEKDTSDYLKQVWDFNKSVESLTSALAKKYKIPVDIESPNSKMNQLIVAVCEALQKDYSETAIRQYSIKE